MSNENKNPEQPDTSWLDEILGTSTPKPDMNTQDILDTAEPQEQSEEQELFAGSSMPSMEDKPVSQEPTQVVPPIPEIEEAPQTPPVTEEPEAPAEKEDAPEAADDSFQVLDDIDRTPKHKVRPKLKKGYGFLGIPHILSTFIWMAVVVIVGVSLGRTLWMCCSDLLAFGKPDKSITVTITDADDIESVAQKLADAGLIEYPQLFTFFADATNKGEDIVPGTFTLNCYYDYNAMINALSYHATSREEVTLTIPEGYTCAQIFALLEENGVCSSDDLEKCAEEGDFGEYWFLDGVEQDGKYWLEGFLFPDTYDFYVEDDAQRVLDKFLDNFDYRFTDLMKEDFAQLQERYKNALSAKGYSATYIEAHQLSLQDVITLASIVEKESANGTESYNISSVFFNRLCDPTNYSRLDSDATVHYAIGDYFGKVEELSADHLSTESPYNTRKYGGLPPGAICNPGSSSIYAALDPNDTNYHYFLLNPETGEHRFAETYAQHQQNQEEMGY